MRRVGLAMLVVILPLFASAETFDQVRLYATGGKSMTNWHGQADIQALHFEIGHALSMRTTVGFVFAPMNVWQPRSWFGDQYADGHESVRAISGSLLVRRTFRPHSHLQWYAEGSTGPMVAEKRVPASTSRFNFASAAGVGVVFNANGHFPIVAGYRLTHISNGGYAPRNPGLNVSSLLFGVQIRTAIRRRR
jgi:hypothetical protein